MGRMEMEINTKKNMAFDIPLDARGESILAAPNVDDFKVSLARLRVHIFQATSVLESTNLRSILLVALAAFAIPAWADNQCIRTSEREIILYDATQKPCQLKFAPADPQWLWKFASDNGRPSCWREDGHLVYVATSSGAPYIYPRESIEDLSACKQWFHQAMEQVVDDKWARDIEACENFDLPEQKAELSCYGALVLAERYFGVDDPRLLLSIENLSVRTSDMAEAEQLLTRSMELRQKHFPADYAGLVTTLGGFGRLRQKQNNPDAAIATFLEAIRVGRQHLGEDHIEVVALALYLGKAYLDAGMLPKAEEQLLRALANAEKRRSAHLNTAHSFAAFSARFLSLIYEKQNKKTEADHYGEIARQHREAAKKLVSQAGTAPI